MGSLTMRWWIATGSLFVVAGATIVATMAALSCASSPAREERAERTDRERPHVEPPTVVATSAAPEKSSPFAFLSAKPSASASAPPPRTQCPAGMIAISGGTFSLGTPDGDSDERPVTRLEMPSLCVDRTEVTVAAYQGCVDTGSCTPASRATNMGDTQWTDFCNAGKADRAQHPINCVDWSMADSFCRSLNRRLPTEQEWEYVARGKSGRKFAWGNDEPTARHMNGCGKECSDMAKKRGVDWKTLFTGSDGFEATAPVGSFPLGATPEGVMDMTGNVWEWTASFYCPYDAPSCSETGRTDRGGGWISDNVHLVRGAIRGRADPGTLSHFVGFRCVTSQSVLTSTP